MKYFTSSSASSFIFIFADDFLIFYDYCQDLRLSNIYFQSIFLNSTLHLRHTTLLSLSIFFFFSCHHLCMRLLCLSRSGYVCPGISQTTCTFLLQRMKKNKNSPRLTWFFFFLYQHSTLNTPPQLRGKTLITFIKNL